MASLCHSSVDRNDTRTVCKLTPAVSGEYTRDNAQLIGESQEEPSRQSIRGDHAHCLTKATGASWHSLKLGEDRLPLRQIKPLIKMAIIINIHGRCERLDAGLPGGKGPLRCD